MTMIARMCLFAAAALLFCTGAARAAERRACKADAEKLCKGILPGGGRIAACLKSHENDLSDECKAAAHEWKEAANRIVESCKEDVDKLCKGVKAGGGRIQRCLRKHRADLSEKCKGAIAETRRKEQKQRKAGKADGAETHEGATEKHEATEDKSD